MARRVDPRPIAFARMGVGLAVIMMAIESHVFLMRVANDRIAFPSFSWAPEPTLVPVSLLLIGGMAAGGALAIGYRSAAAAGSSSGMAVVVLLWDQQTYSSHRTLVILLCCYLAFADSGAAWSVDARMRVGRSGVPYWPQFLMMSQLSVCYFFAGLSKINAAFLPGHVLEAAVWWPLPNGIFPILAVATVAVELFMGICLWLPRFRVIAAMAGVALHLSIVVMLRDPAVLVAFALACVPLYPLFLTRGKEYPCGRHGIRSTTGTGVPRSRSAQGAATERVQVQA